jgi:DNA-binding HxlR family transcriptional regulator
LFDTILHQPIRSSLVATLITNDELPFKALKEKLNLTDGNLSSHLKKLQVVEYIVIEKYFEEKKPKTIIKITSKGKDAFKIYIKQLKQFVKDN